MDFFFTSLDKETKLFIYVNVYFYTLVEGLFPLLLTGHSYCVLPF